MYSGIITRWQVVPQKLVESMYATPRYDAVPMMRRLTHRCQGHPLKSTAHHGQSQVDGGKDSRQFPGLEQTSSAQPYAQWNQQQAEYKNARQDQIDQNANVRMRWPRQDDVIKPESDGGKRRTRGQHGTRQGDGILPQKINWL